LWTFGDVPGIGAEEQGLDGSAPSDGDGGEPDARASQGIAAGKQKQHGQVCVRPSLALAQDDRAEEQPSAAVWHAGCNSRVR
jgi:hypothetical protein